MAASSLVIFGITGDLSTRKLLPALESIVKTDDYKDLSIIGVSRSRVDVAELLKDQPTLLKRTTMFTMDLAEPDDYAKLAARLQEARTTQTLFYLAVPPGAAASIVDFLGQSGLNTPQHKILFEKPFGFDLESAQDFIERTSRYFDEEQLYRIDHYMAKEVAMEVLRLRTNAENEQRIWGNRSIEAITVVATETIGIEGRANFYEQTGALRDFVQGHLMQLLALLLMPNFIPNAQPNSQLTNLPAQRFAALTQLEVADPEKAIRAQYEGYQQEVENPGSQTETFIDLSLDSRDPNWQGVPIRLITGKALSQKRSYIYIKYKDGYEDQLDEGQLLTRNSAHLDAYERVLIEAIEGRKDIFTSSPEVVRSWEILAPVQQAWSMSDTPIARYPVGASLELLNLTNS